MKRSNLIKCGLTVLTALTALLGAGGTAQAADNQPTSAKATVDRPNILII